MGSRGCRYTISLFRNFCPFVSLRIRIQSRQIAENSAILLKGTSVVGSLEM